jgi:hypothetical protein
MAASSARDDQICQNLIQARDAHTSICGTDGDDFHLKPICRGDTPGLAFGIAVKEAEHAEPLHACQKNPRHACLGAVAAAQQHVTPDRFVALLRKTAEGRERGCGRWWGRLGRGHEGHDTSISGFF